MKRFVYSQPDPDFVRALFAHKADYEQESSPWRFHLAQVFRGSEGEERLFAAILIVCSGKGYPDRRVAEKEIISALCNWKPVSLTTFQCLLEAIQFLTVDESNRSVIISFISDALTIQEDLFSKIALKSTLSALQGRPREGSPWD
jgi:hypothetical protein